MSRERATISWSGRQINGMILNDKIDFNHIVQRGLTWERSRKSVLIESIILGYPIPVIFAKRVVGDSNKRGSNRYIIMDGKQRLTTISQFINDEFALTDLPPVVYYDEMLGEEVEEDISGLKFSELSETLQNIIQTTTFTITYFDNLTKEEERELFKRLNAGKPLSTKNRVLASCKDIEGILDIGSHRLFEEMLTDKARKNKNQVALVMKTWCMMNKDIEDVTFESKTFNPIVEETEITEIEKLKLIEVYDLICNTHDVLVGNKEKKVAKKLYTETHMVSLIPYFKKAVEDEYDETLMADWLVDFFGTTDGASVSDSYNEASGSGSAKAVNIQARDKALADSYEEFFKEDEEVDMEEVGNETDVVEETVDVVEEKVEEEVTTEQKGYDELLDEELKEDSEE